MLELVGGTCWNLLSEPVGAAAALPPMLKKKGSLYSCVNSFYVMRNSAAFFSLVALLCIVKVIEGGERRKE